MDYQRSQCCRLDKLSEVHVVGCLVVRLGSMAALVAGEHRAPPFSVQQSFALEDQLVSMFQRSQKLRIGPRYQIPAVGRDQLREFPAGEENPVERGWSNSMLSS